MTALLHAGGEVRAAISRAHDGAVEVHLAPNHPGAGDPSYLARRSAIAALALGWEPGQPLPEVDYTSAEDATWERLTAFLDTFDDEAHARLVAPVTSPS